jgi:hypothetical protein
LILIFSLAEDNQFGGFLKQPVAPAAELSDCICGVLLKICINATEA